MLGMGKVETCIPVMYWNKRLKFRGFVNLSNRNDTWSNCLFYNVVVYVLCFFKLNAYTF